MPPAIFQLLNNAPGIRRLPTTSTLPPPFRDNAAPFYDACGAKGQPARYPADYGQIPPVNLDSGLRIFDRALFSLALSFTSFRRTFVSRAPVTPTAISRMKQRG